MSVQAATYPTLINSAPATADDMMPLAFSGFAHFTAMQVRNRKIKGLDLHMTRLKQATLRLFGMELPDEHVLRSIRLAIANGPADQSLTVTIYSPEGEFTAKSMEAEPAILVRTGLPFNGPSGPVRLGIVEHERFLPSIKHVGE